MYNWLLTSTCSRVASQAWELDPSLTRFFAIEGLAYPESTEAYAQLLIRDTYVIRNLFVRVIANGITADTVYTFRIGGVDKSLTVTFGSGVTGTQQDTTHSESLVDG